LKSVVIASPVKIVQRLASKYTHSGKFSNELRRRIESPTDIDIRYAHVRLIK
jgi:hypothetical protein